MKLSEAQEKMLRRIQKNGQTGYYVPPKEDRSAHILKKAGLIQLQDHIARPATEPAK